jgi:hypothetical protein
MNMEKPVYTPEQIAQWHSRERSKFWDGIYRRLPWDDESWWMEATNYWGDIQPEKAVAQFHFAHIAEKDANMIAFTENDAKGIADRQTVMKPGRYLKKYFPTMSDDTIRHYASMFDPSLREVKFATSEAEMVAVYQHGPHSCMAGPGDQWSYGHPVRVYAAGDLAIAYLGTLEKATARALCWPAKKLYTRLYGDEIRLSAGLKDLGYEEGCLKGAKLQKIDAGNGWVMPYVDWHGVEDCGDHFRLTADGHGDIDAHTTCGYTEMGEECHNCGCMVREDDANGDDATGYSYCYSCFTEIFGWCDSCDSRCYRDDMVEVNHTNYRGIRRQRYVCENCAEDASTCDQCGELWQADNIQEDINDNPVCTICARDCQVCADDDRLIPSGDLEDHCEHCEACRENDDVSHYEVTLPATSPTVDDPNQTEMEFSDASIEATNRANMDRLETVHDFLNEVA